MTLLARAEDQMAALYRQVPQGLPLETSPATKGLKSSGAHQHDWLHRSYLLCQHHSLSS